MTGTKPLQVQTAKNLNNVFQRIGSRFLRDGPLAAVFADTFVEQSGSAVRFPSDDELRVAVLANPLYHWFTKGGRLPDVLWELELASRSKFVEATTRPDNLWVEHIMPKSWDANWPLPSGNALDRASLDPTDTATVAERDRVIHTLGNLTLTTDVLNISMGKGGFSAKQAALGAESLLALNKWFAARSEWNEEAIAERGRHFAERAIEIWPNPTKAIADG